MPTDMMRRLDNVESEQNNLKPRFDRIEEGFKRVETALTKQVDVVATLTENVIRLSTMMEITQRSAEDSRKALELSRVNSTKLEDYEGIRNDVRELKEEVAKLTMVNKALAWVLSLVAPTLGGFVTYVFI